MMRLSAIKDNKIRIKILGGTDSSAYTAAIDFGAFEKTVDSFENDIAEIEVTAEEVQSLETPRVFARMEISNDGKVIDTELVEVMKWNGEVTKRELYLYATVVQSVCPLKDTPETQNTPIVNPPADEGGDDSGDEGDQNGGDNQEQTEEQTQPPVEMYEQVDKTKVVVPEEGVTYYVADENAEGGYVEGGVTEGQWTDLETPVFIKTTTPSA